MSKWLWGLILVLAGLAIWWFIRSQGGKTAREIEADSLQAAHQESLAVWSQRVAVLDSISGDRDSVVAEAAKEDSLQEIFSNAASHRISQLRQQLGTLTEVRDSNRVLVAIVDEQEQRFLADSFRIRLLILQRDTLRRDRDDWKRAAGGLLAQVRQDSVTIKRLTQIVKDECSYLITKGPCPTLVLGPSVGTRFDGDIHYSTISVTAGIPIRLPFLSSRTERRPSAPPADPAELPSSEVVAPEEIWTPLTDSGPASSFR